MTSQPTMRMQIAAHDWSATPLGPRENWPDELLNAVQMILDSRFPKCLFWGEQLISIYNDAFRPILGGKPEALGRPLRDVWAEVWDDIAPIAAAAFAGRATFIEDFPLVVDRGGIPEQAYFTFCYSPLRRADGTVIGMLDTVIETTATVETRQALELANQELAHRLKNSLAIVRAIANQTLRSGCEAETLESFEQRLEALDHAHTVLVQQAWSSGSLRHAVEESLRPNAPAGRLALAGDDQEIGSKTSMALSMMLHELATNASKYGAWSNQGGQVAIAWQVEGETFRFTWRESGGPPVIPPQRVEFGSRLIRRGMGGASQGRSDYAQEGLVFTLDMPAGELIR